LPPIADVLSTLLTGLKKEIPHKHLEPLMEYGNSSQIIYTLVITWFVFILWSRHSQTKHKKTITHRNLPSVV
jgi:hypothetical protein